MFWLVPQLILRGLKRPLDMLIHLQRYELTHLNDNLRRFGVGDDCVASVCVGGE